MTNERTLNVSGMSCNACVRHVTRALSSVQGLQIRDVEVGSARVAYDESVVHDTAIIDAVRAAGYDAQLVP